MDPPAPFHPTATRRARGTVRVGVGVIIVASNNDDNAAANDPQHNKDNDKKNNSPARIYAGIRKGSHGAGTLALPGGHLELYESWFDCACREVREEMDLELTNLAFGHVTNDIMQEEEKHYVTIFVTARQASSAPPKNMEPEKCEGWNAYTWDELKAFSPDKLFGPLKQLVQDEPEAVLRYTRQCQTK